MDNIQEDWKKVLAERALVLERSPNEQSTDADKFFKAAQIINPLAHKFSVIERKYPPTGIDENGARIGFLNSDELKRVSELLEKYAGYFHKNPNDQTKAGSAVVNAVKLLDNYVQSVHDKQGISDMIDEALYDLVQTSNKIRKVLKYD